jgi:hypothetical protein
MEIDSKLIGQGIAVFKSLDIANRLLGPTFDYLGEEIKSWTESRVKNTKDIVDIAIEKAGDDLNKAGKVPPRVLKEVLSEGSFCEDPLTKEYFGGVLAASRAGSEADDRGAGLMKLLGRLSTYQVRAHYIFYKHIVNQFNGQLLNIGNQEVRNSMEIYISINGFIASMNANVDNETEAGANTATILLDILPHIMFGLSKEGLIEQIGWEFGHIKHQKVADSGLTPIGIKLTPSAPGAELFCWAHGKKDSVISQFPGDSSHFSVDPRFPIFYSEAMALSN